MSRMICCSFFGCILAQRHWDELKPTKECFQLQGFAYGHNCSSFLRASLVDLAGGKTSRQP